MSLKTRVERLEVQGEDPEEVHIHGNIHWIAEDGSEELEPFDYRWKPLLGRGYKGPSQKGRSAFRRRR